MELKLGADLNEIGFGWTYWLYSQDLRRLFQWASLFHDLVSYTVKLHKLINYHMRGWSSADNPRTIPKPFSLDLICKTSPSRLCLRERDVYAVNSYFYSASLSYPYTQRAHPWNIFRWFNKSCPNRPGANTVCNNFRKWILFIFRSQWNWCLQVR